MNKETPLNITVSDEDNVSEDDSDENGDEFKLGIEQLRRKLKNTEVKAQRPVSKDDGYGSQRSSTRSDISSWRLSTLEAEISPDDGLASVGQGEQSKTAEPSVGSSGGRASSSPNFSRQSNFIATVKESQGIHVGDKFKTVNVHHHTYGPGSVVHIHQHTSTEEEQGATGKVKRISVKLLNKEDSGPNGDTFSQVLNQKIESNFHVKNCRVIVKQLPAMSFDIEADDVTAAKLTSDVGMEKLRNIITEMLNDNACFGTQLEGREIKVEIVYG
ncbi:uncharacterized protein LOC112042323 [Lingula anatina]|uniref:Uncharacterized protein LOC112042323 n=1 Tax=Lingula anatina TaxID=7574 RepID=A0A2R2MQE0_LINAN|nr:uncharacterized protein LOC112042323 [Lingula anatina]|eukprot:XP_023932460.1 uncharacterized protein LOC112042323 [Lingula anatina]